MNGEVHQVEVEPWERLSEVLRDKLYLTGTKRGCDYGGCGCCTVIMNGHAIYSCMFPAPRAEGKKIITIEGLSNGDQLDPIQQSFIDHGGVQCGYCTPGIIMSAKALLLRNPTPTEEEVRKAIAGNICRCTGYVKVVEAILTTSKHFGSKPEERQIQRP